MTKQELAAALAEALNVLNGLQSELEGREQGYVHNVFAMIPRSTLEAVDFANNGEIHARDLLKR